MKRIAPLLVALVAGLAPAKALAKDPNAALRRFALVASSNDGGPGRTPLRFANSDAQAIADVLGHLGGLRPEDLVVASSAKRGTLQASFERLKALASQTPKGTRRELVIYYSGHSDENGLLLGGDRVTYRELRQWLDTTDAEVRIAILDSCASGSLIRLRGGTHRQSFLSDVSTNARGHAFLTASSANEAAQESDRLGAAFFTHYLVSGLRGAADANRDGLVTLSEAYQFAYAETMRRTEQTAAGAQHPAYDFQLAGTGDLVLTDLRSTKASLVLGESVAGQVFVRDSAGRLVVELRKEAQYPVNLGLGAGAYRVALDAGGSRFEAPVVVDDGKVSRLDRGNFAAAKLEATTARGDEEDVPAEATSPTAPPPPPPAPAPPASKPSVGETLIGERSAVRWIKGIGGYAGLGFNYSQLGQTDGFLADFEAAVLLNRRVAIGLTAGGGYSGNLNADREYITLGSAGLVSRYFFRFDAPVSISVGAVAAVGGASRERRVGADGSQTITQTPVFMFEPQVGGHLDLTRFARIGIVTGYRLAAADKDFGASNVRGFTGGLQLQLGWF